jgi:hypothetical protein
MQHLEYFKVPKLLFEDDRLNLDEFKCLVKIFSKIDPTQLLTKKRWMLEKKEIDINRELIDSLQKKNWLLNENNQLYLNIPESIIPKEKEEVNYEKAGSKIASKWNEFFGTLNLTPTLLQKLLSFMEDGISEDVIIEVMKISSKKAKGNPANYIISILRDYLNRSIYTIHDFKEEKQRMEEYEKRLQEINRKKERRDEKETFESDFEDRYR